MFPYLFSFQFGKSLFQIPSYGVMLAIAFSAGYLDALYKAKKLHMDLKHVERLYILTVFGAMAGSRLFHVFFEQFDYYIENPWKIFAVWEGGYTLYGGIIFCVTAIFVYCRAKKIPFLIFGDLAAGATAIGLFFGRIGCFLAGCCWGSPSNLPWAVHFHHPLAFCPIRDKALHPAQLYEALGALLIYCYLTWRIRDRKYMGQIFFHGILAYAVVRFIVEFFRGDEVRGFVFGGVLSYSQLVSLVLIPFAVAGILTKGTGKLAKR